MATHAAPATTPRRRWRDILFPPHSGVRHRGVELPEPTGKHHRKPAPAVPALPPGVEPVDPDATREFPMPAYLRRPYRGALGVAARDTLVRLARLDRNGGEER